MFRPRSIAIVGASEKPTYGGRLFINLLTSGFKGRIYPVNDKYENLRGLKCYSTVAEIPDELDLVVYAAPRRFIMDVLEQCSTSGAKSIAIITAGLGEADEEGKELQRGIKEFCKKTGIRICGPNCYGLANFLQNVMAIPEREAFRNCIRGRISSILQSGALAFGSLFHYACDREIGFSYVISTGNEVDLEVTDYMRYLLREPNTNVIAIVVEALKNPMSFLEVADFALGLKKPIVALKLGRSALGSKAALSHTGSMTGSDSVYDAVFRQKRIIRVHNLDELIDTAYVLSNLKSPIGDGVAIVSTSGGLGTFLTDSFEEVGISVPELPGESLRKILAIEGLLVFDRLQNPIDIRGQGFSVLHEVLPPLMEDEKYGAIVLAMAHALPNSVGDITRVSESAEKPMFVIWSGRKSPLKGEKWKDQGYKILERNMVFVFYDPLKCVRVIRNYINYFVFRRHRPPKTKTRERGEIHLEETKERLSLQEGVLKYRDSISLLLEYGIPVAKGDIVTTREEAVEVANRMGYPVAIKVVSSHIPHKIDLGVLELNIGSSSQLVESFDKVLKNALRMIPKTQIEGILVKRCL